MGEASSNTIDLVVTATDTGSKSVSKNFFVNFPAGDTTGTKTSDSSKGTLILVICQMDQVTKCPQVWRIPVI